MFYCKYINVKTQILYVFILHKMFLSCLPLFLKTLLFLTVVYHLYLDLLFLLVFMFPTYFSNDYVLLYIYVYKLEERRSRRSFLYMDMIIINTVT